MKIEFIRRSSRVSPHPDPMLMNIAWLPRQFQQDAVLKVSIFSFISGDPLSTKLVEDLDCHRWQDMIEDPLRLSKPAHGLHGLAP